MEIFELLVSAGLLILIWIIQLLHYPSFRFIQPELFSEFSRFHSERISIIVIPLMLAEAVLSVVSLNPVTITIVVLIWISTFALQVPCHNQLQKGYDRACIERLIRSNWIRTILWSLKFIYLLILKF